MKRKVVSNFRHFEVAKRLKNLNPRSFAALRMTGYAGSVLCLSILSACSTISNTADGIGSRMPVIGERCEYWQCFTSYGREQSNLRKRMREAAATPPAPNAAQTPATTAVAPRQLPPGRKPVPQHEP